MHKSIVSETSEIDITELTNTNETFTSEKDQRHSEIELQGKSLGLLLESIEIVNFRLEKEPKMAIWIDEINALEPKVLDENKCPIDIESEDYSKYAYLTELIYSIKVKKQEYSVIVIKVFKSMVLAKDFDLKVFNKEIYFYNGRYWQFITEERFTSFLSDVVQIKFFVKKTVEKFSFDCFFNFEDTILFFNINPSQVLVKGFRKFLGNLWIFVNQIFCFANIVF